MCKVCLEGRPAPGPMPGDAIGLRITAHPRFGGPKSETAQITGPGALPLADPGVPAIPGGLTTGRAER